MRKCVGCNEMKPKKELIRVVRTPDKEILLDLIGKVSGKGAYICHDITCFQKAVKAKRFERAFSCEIPQLIFDKMEVELKKDEP